MRARVRALCQLAVTLLALAGSPALAVVAHIDDDTPAAAHSPGERGADSSDAAGKEEEARRCVGDADSDSVCDTADSCPLDDWNDADGDGVCGDQDSCPHDDDNDLDQDGLCRQHDSCPRDFYNDFDSDNTCDSDDPCPTVQGDCETGHRFLVDDL
jgi:hypothetical protein